MRTNCGGDEIIPLRQKGKNMEYVVYQLNDTADRTLRFAPFENQEKVRPENYNLVYTGDVQGEYPENSGLPDAEFAEKILDNIFKILNDSRPIDFHGHSLSVSDIVCLQNGILREFWYVDSFGFVKLDTFDGILVTDIDWDTDGEPVEGLPESVILDPSVDEDDIADKLTDAYGYCVFSLNIDK